MLWWKNLLLHQHRHSNQSGSSPGTQRYILTSPGLECIEQNLTILKYCLSWHYCLDHYWSTDEWWTFISRPVMISGSQNWLLIKVGFAIKWWHSQLIVLICNEGPVFFFCDHIRCSWWPKQHKLLRWEKLRPTQLL